MFVICAIESYLWEVSVHVLHVKAKERLSENELEAR